MNPEDVEVLDLSAQGIHVLPERINELTQLKQLDLSENFLLEIDFKKISLPNLNVLNLSNNPGFNTFSLEGIGMALPQLKSLDMSRTNSIVVGSEIATCSQLTSLNLSQNSIQFLPEEIGELDNLKSLNVSYNNLQLVGWLDGLWGLQYLDVSGNGNLSLNDLGMALLLKESLVNLTVSVESKHKFGLPSVFEELVTKTLTIKNCQVDGLNNRVVRNPNIETIVFDFVKFTTPAKFVAWINRTEYIKQLEFKNMEVPNSLDEIVSVDVIKFDNCTFANKEELKKIKPRITLVAVGTDIRSGEYIGNSKLLDMRGTPTQASQDIVEMSTEMQDNTLKPIVDQNEQISMISGVDRARIETNSSIFEIPSEAFLTQSGQIYTGEVKVVVKEYMDPVMNALAGTPMTFRSEDGTNELFSSSGMLDFRAYDDSGNELKPNPNNIIQVQMNDLQPSQSPDLFTFNGTTRNWERTRDWDTIAPVRSSDRMRTILDSLNKLSAETVTGFTVSQVLVNMTHKKRTKDPYELTFVTQNRTKRLKEIEGFQQRIETSNVDQQWIGENITWKIDTLISDEAKYILDQVKKDMKRVRKYFGDESNVNDASIPRVVKKLKMEPNIENDNYSLTFLFRDTVRRFPVVASYEGPIKKIQSKEKEFYKVYLQKKKIADEETALIETYKTTVLEEYAKTLRQSRATALSQLPDYTYVNRDYLRFGLTSFGLVNCDYFSRSVPDEYVMLDTVGVDEDGKRIAVPYDIRNVYVDDNVFVSTTADKVPIFKNKRSIIFFLIGPFEIAVIKGWELISNGFRRPIIERVPFDPETDSSDIRQRILDAGR